MAYYAEYQPYDRLERDLDLMAAAGLLLWMLIRGVTDGLLGG